MWTILEDSVKIDELEGVYGELPEGTIASITLFAVPEGGEEIQADSDVEPLPIPKSKKDEASLRAEAASLEHKLTHRPKNPFCPVCQRAKMLSPQARRKGGFVYNSQQSFRRSHHSGSHYHKGRKGLRISGRDCSPRREGRIFEVSIRVSFS